MRLVGLLALSVLVASCGVSGGERMAPGGTETAAAEPVSAVLSSRNGRDALNGFRAENGRSPVAVSPQLEEAARAHARDMGQRAFFDHSGSDGSNVMTRARRAGYAPCFIAENIAKGQRSLAEAMATWAGSSTHRRNMLSPKVTEFGLVRGEGDLWVMVLGRRC